MKKLTNQSTMDKHNANKVLKLLSFATMAILMNFSVLTYTYAEEQESYQDVTTTDNIEVQVETTTGEENNPETTITKVESQSTNTQVVQSEKTQNPSVKAVEKNQNVFNVATFEDIKLAVDTINAAQEGKFTINLTADITIPDFTTLKFNTKNEITILGNGHTISTFSNCIMDVRNGATLNLGSKDASEASKLDITGGPGKGWTTSLIVVTNGTLNMYDGVTIRDHVANGAGLGGAISVNSDAIFNMYGGTITNCHMGEPGGAVGLDMNATFNMYGGTISNNRSKSFAGAIIVGYYDASNATFNMYGGTISNNNGAQAGGAILINPGSNVTISGNANITNNQAELGGAIVITEESNVTISGNVNISNNQAELGGAILNLGGNLTINSATITNNSAAIGGGIYITELDERSVKTTISGNVYNNKATEKADDIYAENAKDVILSSISEGLKLDCNSTIDGWYIDDDTRWGTVEGEEGHNHLENAYYEKYDPDTLAQEYVALKAAHGLDTGTDEPINPDEPTNPDETEESDNNDTNTSDKITIANIVASDIPRTGENPNYALYLMLVSGLGLLIAGKKSKKILGRL